MQQNMAKLPNYTCDVSIERVWRTAPGKPWRPLDHVQLSLTVVNGQELYGRPSGGLMRHEDPSKLIAGGPMTTGEFAELAEALFAAHSAQIHYAGPEKLDGRAIYSFDYRVPLLDSHYDVTSHGETARVAYKGSFWVAQDSLDVLRIERRTDEIPMALGIDSLDDQVEYGVVSIAGRLVSLPRSALLEIDAFDGRASVNSTQFDNCHEFHGEAKMLPEGP